MRKSGILMPISSIPGGYGIGSFSKESYEFVDFLKKANQKIWQILPLGPTGYGDSPYQAFSAFAGNPYFISLDKLIEEGAKSLRSMQDKIDTDKMNVPSFLMVLTGTGDYAYRRQDGVFVIPIGCLKV